MSTPTHAALTLVFALLVGCSSISVDRAHRPTISSSWRATAVTGYDLSPRSLQLLRRYDLLELYPDSLHEVCTALHAEALRDPRSDLLFTLAELHYLRAEKADRRHEDASLLYHLTAGYAYHFLFDEYQPPVVSGLQRVSAREESPTEAFDPRFRIACDLYNAAVAKCLSVSQKTGKFDVRKGLTLPGSEGRQESLLLAQHKGFGYKPDELGPILLCNDFEVHGIASRHRTYGLGVPLIGTRRPEVARPTNAFYPENINFPMTAFLRFEGDLNDLRHSGTSQLEFYNPLTVRSVRVGTRSVPLESDLTTPLAYYLANVRLEAAGYQGFFSPEALGKNAGLRALEPYQPGKIPVVLVHGLLSSPTTWTTLFNDLQADPAIRDRFQFWVYFYPTGSPYLATAADLRTELARVRDTLDPARSDPALNDMVFIGHSMGGLVSRLLTVEGGDDFWSLASPVPADTLRLQPISHQELRNTYYFARQRHVTRVIFMGTPHRGSKLSPSLVGRIGARLAGLPQSLLATARDLSEDNPQLASVFQRHSRQTSVDLLDPSSPALQLIEHRPKSAGVRYHSVIGVTPRTTRLLERLFAGADKQPGDGVVPYSSAHLAVAESELVVNADHFAVHQHPGAIREVRRILLEHAREHERKQQQIWHAR